MPRRQQNGSAPPSGDAAVAELLAERARIGLGLMALAVGVLLVTDVALDRTLLVPLVTITLFQVGCVTAGFLALRWLRSRRAVAATPVVVLAGIFASGVVSDVVTQNPFGTGLSALVTALVSATLMPWGASFQLATVLVTAVPGAVSMWLCTGSFEALGYSVGPSSILLLACVGVAGAFERARLERERIEGELRLLQQVSLEVGAASDLEAALTVVLRRMCEASGWAIGQAWIPRAGTNELECVAWWSADPSGPEVYAESRRLTFPEGVGLPGLVLARREAVWVADVQAHAGVPRHRLAQRVGLVVGVGIPVLADGDVIAVLEFFSRTRHPEDTRTMRALAGAAVQLGTIMRRKRAERLAEEAAETAEALVEVGRTLSTHLGQPDMLDRVITLAAGAMDCDWSATFAWDGDALTLVAAAGLSAEIETTLRNERLRPDGFDFEAASPSRALVEIPDVATADVVPTLVRTMQPAAVLYAPMHLAGGVMGVQIHGYRTRVGSFTTRQRRLASGVADATAIAVANARLIDDLQASSRLKSEFVATMSHELRTPLNIIIGYSDMLAEGVLGALGAEQQATVARVQRAGVELLDLVNATLDMGRLEAGRDAVCTDPVDVDALMHQLDAELGPLVGPRVALAWQNRLGDVVVMSDRQKIKTILKNLVGNALKFTQEGRVEAAAAWDGDRLRLTVRDSGVGIPPESLPVIFEMFRQVDGSSTRTFGGVGLGLHIVRRLVELLGGDVTVASTVGVGSTFTVTLPATIDPLPAQALRA